MSTIQAIFTVMCLPRRKIAPVSVTCRLSLSMLYVFLFVLHVVRNVNSLLVYDRQTLLDLRSQPIDRSNFDHKDYGSLPRSWRLTVASSQRYFLAASVYAAWKTVAGAAGADSVFPSRGNCSPRLGMNMRNLRPLYRAAPAEPLPPCRGADSVLCSRLGLVNARSLSNKSVYLKDFFVSREHPLHHRDLATRR